jgi:hypothetical protein
MSPGTPQEPLQQRIYRELAEELTAHLEGQELLWPAIHAAEGRMRARVRRSLGRRLEVPDTYLSMADALMVLAEESPEQAAHDEALVSRWRQVHGMTVDAGARVHIAERLEEMARRQQAAGDGGFHGATCPTLKGAMYDDPRAGRTARNHLAAHRPRQSPALDHA